MAAKDAVALAIATALRSVERKKQFRNNQTEDPAVNIAMLAYWDGVCNLASGFMDVLDDKATVEEASDAIEEFADRLRDVMEDALEGDE